MRRSCGQCGGRVTHAFTTRDFNRNVSDALFEYFRCRSCGSVYLDPVPSDLGSYYPPGYHRIPESVDALFTPSPDEHYKLAAVGERGGGRRLLEIGPSYGRFAALAKRAGFDVEALELDPECCRFLESIVGVRAVRATNLLEGLSRLGEYDVVALWHSIEHLPEPWNVLDAIAPHVAAGGQIAIATPNPLSLQFRIFSRNWFHLDAPRHVALMPPAVVESRLARHGFVRSHFTSQDAGSQECSAHGWVASSLLSFPKWMFELPYIHLGWWLRAKLRRIEAMEPYGPAYTMVFRRR